MALRSHHVKIKRRNQTLVERDVIVNPRHDADVLDVLGSALDELGIDHPTSDHSIEVYKSDGTYLRKLHAR
jgi:hypothetical protein